MAERFRDKVNIQPVRTDTGQAQTLMSLVDRLENFKNFAYQKAVDIGTERAVSRGVSEAEKVQLEEVDGVTKAPEFKEKKFIGGVEISAYNKTLRNAYLVSLDNDNREALAKIASENPDDLINFNDASEAYKKGVVKSVDPSVRAAVQQDLDQKITNYRIRIQDANINKNMAESRRVSEDNINSAIRNALREVRNGDHTGDVLASDDILKAFSVLDTGVESGFWDQTFVDEKKREIERDVTAQKFLSEIDSRANVNIKSAYDYIDELSQRVRKGFTPDEWTSVLTEGQQNVNRKRARFQDELKVFKKQLSVQNSIDRGMQFLDPNVPADPAKGSQDRKDVNAAYDVVSQDWVNLPPMEQFNKNIDFVKNTGIMPDPLIRGINASMRSGNAEQVFVFSKFVDTISNEPNAANILRDLPPESRAVSKQVADSIDSGIDIETAVEIARKNTYGLTESEKESIKLKTREIAPELPSMLEDMVDKEFDPSIIPFFGEEPELNPAIQADFNINFERFMVMTDGNETQSKKLAFDSLKRVWGATEIGGPKRMMKYSPEVFYTVPGVDDKWMLNQYEKDIRGLKIDPDKTVIAVDFETANSDSPSWSVMFIDEDGMTKPLLDDGLPVRWSPDFKTTREYFELRQKPTEETMRAKRIREEMVKIGTALQPEEI